MDSPSQNVEIQPTLCCWNAIQKIVEGGKEEEAERRIRKKKRAFKIKLITGVYMNDNEEKNDWPLFCQSCDVGEKSSVCLARSSTTQGIGQHFYHQNILYKLL